MLLKAYSVFDSKSEVFSPPFFLKSRGLAIRQFMELLKDKGTMPGKYPSDFTLFELGDFDDVKGLMIPLGAPNNLGVGTIFLTPESEK